MSRMALLTLVAALALPISLAGQDPEPDPVAVEVAVAALRGLQADGVLPGEPEQLRTILVEREDASSPQRAFDLEVLAAVGMTADAEGLSHPECEFRPSQSADGARAPQSDEPTWVSRCALPGGRVPVAFHVTGIGESSARVMVRWMTVAEGEEFLFFPASYSNYEVLVTRDRASGAWTHDSVLGHSSAAINPRPRH